MSQHFKARLYKSLLLSIVFSLLGVTIALAASGELDFTFDHDGRLTTDFDGGRTDEAHAIALQADGKILAAGYHNPGNNLNFALARYNTDGSLDTTFSGDGKRMLDFGKNEFAYSVTVQADGKIVLAGITCVSFDNCDLALARFNKNGALDTSFSGDGKLTTVFGGGDNGSLGGLAIQSDGKIVVAGYMHNGTDRDFAVYRYLSNGSLDPTFSRDGRFRFGFVAGQDEAATDLAIQTDGKILIAGYASTGDPLNSNFAVARLNANGTLDTTFSGDGKRITEFGGRDFAYGLALGPNGKILLVGNSTNPTTFLTAVAMVRYNPNGNLDNTFGELLPTGKRSGKRVFNIVENRSSEARDVIVQQDGKIVITGSSLFVTGHPDFVLVRLKPNGADFDTSFSGDGRVFILFSSFISNQIGFAIVRQPSDGKYVVAGTIANQFDFVNGDFALARVLP